MEEFDKRITGKSKSHIELVCAGISWRTRQLVRQYCNICHFPNFAKAYKEKRDFASLRTRFVFVDETLPDKIVEESLSENEIFYTVWKNFWATFGQMRKICRTTFIIPSKSSLDLEDSDIEVVDPLANNFEGNWFDIEFVFIKCDWQSPFLKKYLAKREKNGALITLVDDLTSEENKKKCLMQISQSTIDFARHFYEERRFAREQKGEKEIPWNQIDPSDYEKYVNKALVWEYRLRAMSCNITRPKIEKLNELLKKEKEEYAIVEHNRWAADTLIMGYSPLSEIRLIDFVDSEDKETMKKVLKKEEKIHVNLVSFNQLKCTDP